MTTFPSSLPHDLETETRARAVLDAPHSFHAEVILSARRVIERNAEYRYYRDLDDLARERDLAAWLAPLREMGGYRHDG